MIQSTGALEGRGSGSSFWTFLFHFGCLKLFLELGLKLEEFFSLSSSLYWQSVG